MGFRKVKQTGIKNGNYKTDNMKSDFQKYRNFVQKLTDKNKKQLLLIWNGHDYYDNQLIEDNFNLLIIIWIIQQLTTEFPYNMDS